MKHYILDTYNITSLIRQPAGADKAIYFLVTLVRYFSYRYPSYRITLAVDGVMGHDPMLPENVVIAESGSRKADDVIKDLVDMEMNKPNCVVVSSDLEVFSYARISACKAVKSDEFLDRLQRIYSEATASKQASSEKPITITSKEKQRLLNAFDKELPDESFADDYRKTPKKKEPVRVAEPEDFESVKPKKKTKQVKKDVYDMAGKPFTLSDEEKEELLRMFGKGKE